MKSRNIIFIEDVFSSKKTQKNYSFKRINDASINNYHQYEDNEVEPRSKMKKKTRIFYHDFLTYLLENEISNLLWSNVMFESFLLERDGK